MSIEMIVSNTTAYDSAKLNVSSMLDNSGDAARLREQENATKEARRKLFETMAKDVVATSKEGDTVSVSEAAKKQSKQQANILLDDADGTVTKRKQPELYDLIGYTREQMKGFYLEGRISRYDFEKDEKKRDALVKQLSREEQKQKIKEENKKELQDQINAAAHSDRKADESRLEEERLINSKIEKAKNERRILESRESNRSQEQKLELQREKLLQKKNMQRIDLDKNESIKVQSNSDAEDKIVSMRRNNNEISNGLMNRHSQEEGILWDYQLEA